MLVFIIITSIYLTEDWTNKSLKKLIRTNKSLMYKTRLKSGRWDSNPRHSPWEGDVLPLNYARLLLENSIISRKDHRKKTEKEMISLSLRYLINTYATKAS